MPDLYRIILPSWITPHSEKRQGVLFSNDTTAMTVALTDP